MTKKEKASPQLLLEFYGLGPGKKWYWQNLDTDESSQEFASEEAALNAWRDDKLQWSRLEDLGN